MLANTHPLAAIVGVLGILNNIFLLSSPWVATPVDSLHGPPARAGLNPVVAAITYAIWQPLCLAVFMWTGLQQWINVLGMVGAHACMSHFILIYWDTKTLRQLVEEQSDREKGNERQDSPMTIIQSLRKAEIFSWIPPVQTAAASDAAFILFGADLACNPEQYSYSQNKVLYFFVFFALAMYLVTRFVDYQITVVTRRRGIYAMDSYTWTQRLTLFGLLALLFVVRVGSGWLTEQFCGFPILKLVLWPKDVKIVLEQGKLDWIVDVRNKNPWLSLTMTMISIPLQFIGVYFLRKAARED